MVTRTMPRAGPTRHPKVIVNKGESVPASPTIRITPTFKEHEARMQSKLFSLDDNPFRILKASYRSSAAEISDLVEDAELDGVAEEEILQKARQALVTPRSRLTLELAWLPELSQLQISKVYELFGHADAHTILSQIDHFPELAKANITAHLCSHKRASIQAVHSLAQSWDEIDESNILNFINEERRSSGFPKIETQQLREVLNEIRLRHAIAATNWVWSLPSPGKTMNGIVEEELDSNPEGVFLRQFVDMYDKESEPPLAAIQDSIRSAIESAKVISKDLVCHVREILKLLEDWDTINQPVQIYFQSRGQEEGRSKKLSEAVRELCLDLANNHGCYDEALQLSAALLRTFPELESVAESLKGDISALESLTEQKKISDQLDPLVEACERAKNNSASFSQALKSNGLAEGGNRYLNDIAKALTIARKGLPDPGMAFLVVRDLALSLNNDSNDPESAFLLVRNLIEIGGNSGPKVVMDKLREDRSILHKNWKMKELDRQSGNLSGMQKVVDELLVYASATDRRDLQQLKSKIAGKRFAKRTKFVVYAGIAGVIGFFVLAESFNGSATRSVYRLPANSQTSVAAEPAPNVSDPYQEDIPPVGSSLSLTRPQVRYCIFQGSRLDYIRMMTATNYQIDRFNVLIDDYNQRCSNFSYVSGVLQSVQGEVSSRSVELQADARRMVASW